MELKITSNDRESIDFLRKFIFENNDSIFAEEEYEHSDGYNKEPVVIGIILALGTAKAFDMISQMFESYQRYKTERLKILSTSGQNNNSDSIKMHISKNDKILVISEADFKNCKSLDELEKKFKEKFKEK